MVILVRVIGVIIVTLGIVILLNPKAFKVLIDFFKVGRRLYWNGLLRLLFGIVLLLGASQCRRIAVVIAIGILSLLGGVMIFALDLEKMKLIIDWWSRRSLALIRLISLLALALGALLIYSA